MTAQRRRHARERQTRTGRAGVPRALLQVGLTFSAVGAAVTGGATAAAAAESAAPGLAAPLSPQSVQPGVDGAIAALGAADVATAGALRPAKDQRLHPLAGTPVDPLDNSVGTQVADFRSVSTDAVTGLFSDGGSLRELPAAGGVLGALPG